MRCLRRIVRILGAVLLLWSCLFQVQAAGAQTETEDAEISVVQEELLGQIELEEIQKLVDGILDEKSFSIKEAVMNMMKGEEPISKEAVQDMVRSFFFSGINQEKGMLFRILLLILLAAVLSNFADVFENGYAGNVSFYIVYLVLFMTLMENFANLGNSLTEYLVSLTELMRVLAPAYFIATAASAGASTATVFYEVAMLLIWTIQWFLVYILLPGAKICVLLKLVNHLSREEMLGKMAELLETMINWGLKTLSGTAVGLQVIRNLVAPVMDSLKRSVIGKTAAAIPGIGNAVNTITELVLTSAVLVRNSLGGVSLVLLAAAGLGPILHYGFLSLSYRFLAALAQPVSDKRIVGALSSMGEGCAMLLKIFFTAELLCMLAFLILLAGG